ncbi:acetyltransferase (GNAT) family protein [Kribbella orskensis]|uniref:Acetyltransferase (GNAT) family protein n=1 Tax=Kribbella orskensis TaxID=2512216 RepID=A0ABY2BRB5_9ACTN|nr:GNAT family N-acetyltransferase [Kribbella orskensis]TCN43343.1 acetyltransferase (GNAT) family protein [Kribbella sp. VKM Ac-2500]TCO29301.1 acetyltransferase (GNAT) family protein [Kribbella orskensis]
MRQPHIWRWWQQDWAVERWVEVLEEQAAGEHSIPCMTALDGEDLAYVELYRVRHDRLAEYYACEEHDWGVHIAIGDATRVGRGIGRRLLRSLADALLRADPRSTGWSPNRTPPTPRRSARSPRPASNPMGSYSCPRKPHY